MVRRFLLHPHRQYVREHKSCDFGAIPLSDDPEFSHIIHYKTQPALASVAPWEGFIAIPHDGKVKSIRVRCSCPNRHSCQCGHVFSGLVILTALCEVEKDELAAIVQTLDKMQGIAKTRKKNAAAANKEKRLSFDPASVPVIAAARSHYDRPIPQTAALEPSDENSCGICKKQAPDARKWIYCGHCDLPFHCSCAGVKSKGVNLDDPNFLFFCKKCGCQCETEPHSGERILCTGCSRQAHARCMVETREPPLCGSCCFTAPRKGFFYPTTNARFLKTASRGLPKVKRRISLELKRHSEVVNAVNSQRAHPPKRAKRTFPKHPEPPDTTLMKKTRVAGGKILGQLARQRHDADHERATATLASLIGEVTRLADVPRHLYESTSLTDLYALENQLSVTGLFKRACPNSDTPAQQKRIIAALIQGPMRLPNEAAAQAYIDQEREFGTKIHSILDELLKNMLQQGRLASPEDKLARVAIGDGPPVSFLKEGTFAFEFLAERGYVPLLSEGCLCDPDLWLFGSFDLLARDPVTKEIVLIDWKRTRLLSDLQETAYLDYFLWRTEHRGDRTVLTKLGKYELQLMLYCIILRERYGIEVSRLIVFNLHPRFEGANRAAADIHISQRDTWSGLQKDATALLDARRQEVIEKMMEKPLMSASDE